MVERSKCMNVPELRFKGFKQEWDFCSVGDFYYFINCIYNRLLLNIL